MPTQQHYTTTRTARYYTAGAPLENCKQFWFACHGFAQLAGDFINEFEPLTHPDGRVIAPEALNRFYTKGFDGRVGATWMTRDDRENEIADYVGYLDGLYRQETSGLPAVTRTHILGFSQGCTTVCRWVAMRKPKFNNLWLCSGDLPHDLVWEDFAAAMNGKKLHLVMGNDDPLIPKDKLETVQSKLKTHGLNYHLHVFEGAHVINLGVLQSAHNI